MTQEEREAIVSRVVDELSPAVAKAVATWFEDDNASDALDAEDTFRATALALANAFASSLASFERRYHLPLDVEQIVSFWSEALHEYLTEYRERIPMQQH